MTLQEEIEKDLGRPLNAEELKQIQGTFRYALEQIPAAARRAHLKPKGDNRKKIESLINPILDWVLALPRPKRSCPLCSGDAFEARHESWIQDGEMHVRCNKRYRSFHINLATLELRVGL